MTDSPTCAFGLDAVGLDDRMRLFSFITAPARHDYPWVLRAIDRARANRSAVDRSRDAGARRSRRTRRRLPRGDEVDLAARLDALDDWGVLDRTQDAARAATIAEYRRRHSVYQFTEAGHRAFSAVESVLGATMAEHSLSKTVFKSLLRNLEQLVTANRGGDGDTVLERFNDIDRSLNGIAEQAARFYAMLGDLARTTEVNAANFQTHKDALISHLRDFHNELQRFGSDLNALILAELGVTDSPKLRSKASSMRAFPRAAGIVIRCPLRCAETTLQHVQF
ncbi:MAG TPA: DUF2397 family protein [Glycomyces sp.]|nr:DUF2397 family protein [Glycomyces sp.]